jgi:hypothetical protein
VGGEVGGGRPLMAAALGARRFREGKGPRRWSGAAAPFIVQWGRRTGAGRPGTAPGCGGRRRRGEEGGAAGGGRRPRQVGPTCRWLCEREGGRRAERAGLGQNLRWAAAGKGDWVDLLFFSFFLFKSFFKPISNLLNSNLLHVFKLKF